MIEVRGVIEYCDSGHTFVDVVVTVGISGRLIKHEVGVDVKPTRGKIITLLAGIYGVPPGEIEWPAHIELETPVATRQ